MNKLLLCIRKFDIYMSTLATRSRLTCDSVKHIITEKESFQSEIRFTGNCRSRETGDANPASLYLVLNCCTNIVDLYIDLPDTTD